MTEPTSPPARYAVLVPVKPPAHGKSRLTRLAGLTDAARRRLASAFAEDTVAACAAAQRVGAVLVVTDDAFFSTRLVALGAAAIPDGAAGDLNASLGQGAAEAARRWPELEPVVVCADLPALRAEELDTALDAVVPGGPSIVVDADGRGTTLYTAPLPQFAPLFGPDSRAAHVAAGALELPGDLATLRRDVDDLAGLGEAARLGLGARTIEAIADLGLRV
ncbi:2-phospho-L-lactate guanylyltransferase [Nocardioides ferulae]|uniref:2-phospho-L-lactate guanylyltransferase n=1 Tax=Nocardioides ferulae TaxID=2340821 RepID=UPI000EB1E60B|nr:2-phospho-L-lactate guanylyltransferase [Nocardioides ferulae]